MTKKDYILIANAVREAWEEYENDYYPEQEALYKVVECLCSALGSENPSFNRELFTRMAVGDKPDHINFI